jgi:uncharacterized protein YgiM (DUF1202 family)
MCRFIVCNIMFVFILILLVQGACAQEAFSAGDRVWAKSTLHVREAPGTSSSEIDSVIKGTIGTVTEGPIFEEEYNWWNIRYDLGTTGWSAENWLEKAPEGPQPSTDFSLWSEEAIKWGENHSGSEDWWDDTAKQGYCLRFVANAFMQNMQ